MKTPEVTIKNFHAEAREIEKTLKPCPFCGNKEVEFALIHPQYWGEPDMDYWCYWEILCPECGAMMDNARLDSQTWDEAKEEIIDNWNRRVDMSQSWTIPSQEEAFEFRQLQKGTRL